MQLGTDPLARVVRGRAALAAGHPGEALASADAALSQRPHFPEAWSLRADALDRLDRPDDAARARERHRALDPG